MLMKLRVVVAPAVAVLAGALVVAAPAQGAKKPLDHDVYDIWNRIAGQELSDDGAWALYTLAPGDGDGSLHIHRVATDREIVIERGAGAHFTNDGAYVVAKTQPLKADVEKAKKAKKKPDKMPKAGLAIVALPSGEVTTIARVKSFKLPKKGAGWVAYLLEKPLPEKSKKEDAKNENEAGEKTAVNAGEENSATTKEEKTEAKEDVKKKSRKKKDGTTLVLRRLATGAETRYEHVLSYAINEPGDRLAFAVSTKKGDSDGVFVVEMQGGQAGEPISVMTGKGDYKSLVFDKAGAQLAFLANRDAYDEEQPAYSLYRWRAGWDDVKLVAHERTAGVPEGWWVSEHRAPNFSEEGDHLFFGTAPRPESEVEDDTPEDEKVKVDVWSWTDDLLQPQQLVQLKDEQKRSYLAIAHLYKRQPDIVVQLATLDIPDVVVGDEGDAEVALGWSNLPYRKMISWDVQVYSDIYLINPSTGEREKVVEKVRAGGGFGAPMRLSPDAKYVYWWDSQQSDWFALDTNSRKLVNLTEDLPFPVYNELHDSPSLPGSYGLAGWLDDDEGVLIYDKHDVWLIDPTGTFAPRNVTEGYGRAHDLRFRVVDLDHEEEEIDPREPLLLSAFNLHTKDAGFFRDRVRGSSEPEKLVMAPKRFGPRFRGPMKADDADALLYTREDFREFPDLWVADLDFKGATKISDANPQQDDYLWGDVELVEWTSGDGERLQGMLYKPDGFDPSVKYPMMVYFYERNSDNLRQHWAPAPSRSIINFSFYVSRGYVLFVPDIPYKVGFPGESAYSAVVPGVTHILDMGFVDPKRVGVEGHSWGGYQIAYLVTRTNMFAAAEAGAPVSNMTSAYGGIRWASGLSRMFQYEHTQSRIGGTLWNSLQRYMENSPLFFADKVETPLLMMHNDNDGAVPWYQGIEFFVALRRLGKRAWMLNYNGESHGLTKWHNKKDWAVRMQQFFDHYLMDAPAPEWLAHGVPAIKKGKTLGLELVEDSP